MKASAEQIILFIMAAICIFFGIALWETANSVIHQIAALQIFQTSVVCICAALIVQRLKK